MKHQSLTETSSCCCSQCKCVGSEDGFCVNFKVTNSVIVLVYRARARHLLQPINNLCTLNSSVFVLFPDNNWDCVLFVTGCLYEVITTQCIKYKQYFRFFFLLLYLDRTDTKRMYVSILKLINDLARLLKHWLYLTLTESSSITTFYWGIL